MLRADLAQYYPAKALFELVLGRSALLRVKDCGSLSSWRSNYSRLLRAIGMAAAATVDVVDPEWHTQFSQLLAHGIRRIQGAEAIDELHAAVAATLGELSLLQLGFVPRGHYRLDVVPILPRNWRLNPVRTVQYVQSAEQRATQVRLKRKPSRESET